MTLKPMDDKRANSPASSSRLWLKVLVPIAIGLGVVAWLFYSEFSPEIWQSIHFTPRVITCIIVGWVFMAGRDFGLTWRFRALTGQQLPWSRALRVDMLCEFTSAVTPSAVGGSALGMIYLNREGIEIGRATTLMMTTLFLDELFFVIACPIAMLLIPYDELFAFSNGGDAFTLGLRAAFWIVYSGVVLWTATLFTGIFVKPLAVSRALKRLFALRWLRRWQHRVDTMADDMVATSRWLRGKSKLWWAETFGATALSWTSRFLLVNALFWGFVPAADQLVVFGRQLVMWVVLIVSPTPGGAGLSEWIFTEYYGDMLGVGGTSIALIVALFWRLISYYIYLIVGVCLLPGFFRRRGPRSTALHQSK